MDSLRAQRFHNTVPPDEIYTLKRQAAGFVEPASSWAAILQLWVIGEDDFIELLWWRKDDSETRAFIVALEWCMCIELPDRNANAWPGGLRNYADMSARFAEQERIIRISETELVRKNHMLLKAQLFNILSASKVRMAEQYKDKATSQQK